LGLGNLNINSPTHLINIGAVAVNDLEVSASTLNLNNDITATGDINFSSVGNTAINSDTSITAQSATIDQITGNNVDLTITVNDNSTVSNIDIGTANFYLNTDTADTINVANLHAKDATYTALNDANTNNLNLSEHTLSGKLTITGFDDTNIQSTNNVDSIEISDVDNVIMQTGAILEIGAQGGEITADNNIEITQIQSNSTEKDNLTINAGNNIIDVEGTDETSNDLIALNNNAIYLNAGNQLDDLSGSYYIDDVPTPVNEIDIVEEQKGTISSKLETSLNAIDEVESKNVETEQEDNQQEKSEKASRTVEAIFNKQCKENNNKKSCEKNKGIAKFVGRLLVGGELPNYTE